MFRRNKLVIAAAAAIAVMAGVTGALASPQSSNQGVVAICTTGGLSGGEPTSVIQQNGTSNPCAEESNAVLVQGLNTGGPVSGYQRVSVTGTTQNLGTNSTSNTTDANCPGNKAVTGGGVDANGDNAVAVRETYPPDSDTWRGRFGSNATNPGDASIDVYAVCVNATN
jgi:hypothetical protein